MNVAPYALMRIANLPISELAGLRCEATARLIDRWMEQEEQGRPERQALSDALYDLCPHVTDVSLRRRLLQWKRDLHNDRLPADRTFPQDLRSMGVPSLAERLSRYYEERLHREEMARGLEATFASEEQSARQHLQRLAGNEFFRRGLALSSLSLASKSERYRLTPLDQHHRRLSKAETGIVRYISRMATKTAPFSTFTLLAPARWEEGTGPPVRLPAVHSVHTSAKVNHGLIHRLAQALAARPDIREHLPVRPNPALWIENGQIKAVVRRNHPVMQGLFLGTLEQLVQVKASQAALWVLEMTSSPREPLTYAQVAERLAQAARPPASPQEARSLLDRLIDLGLITCGFELPDQAPDPAGLLAAQLEPLEAPAARQVLAFLRSLRERVGSYCSLPAAERAQTLAAIDAGLTHCLQETGLGPLPGNNTPLFEEAALAAEPAVLSAGAWAEARAGLEALAGILPILDVANYYRLTAAVLHRRAFGGRPVPLLRFFEALYPLLGTYDGGPIPDNFRSMVNPLAIPELDVMLNLYGEFGRSMAALVRQASPDEELHVDRRLLEQLARQIPDCLRRPRAYTFFCQPVFSDPPSLVLGQDVFCGPGRAFSRFIELFGPQGEELRQSIAGAIRSLAGPEVVPAEILCSFGFNANLHPPVTPVQLVYPGARVDPAAPVQSLPVTELEVRAGEHEYDLQLYSPRLGRAVMPVDLTYMAMPFIPPLYRTIVCLSGPWFLMPFHISDWAELQLSEEQRRWMRRYPRVRLGGLILQRAQWKIPRDRLPVREPGEGDLAYFRRIRRWRRDLGLPEEVFVRANRLQELRQRRAHANQGPAAVSDLTAWRDTFRKPQYVDFRSWLLVQVYEQLLDNVLETLHVEEMLPSAEHLMEIPGLGKRAMEVIIEVHSGPGPGERRETG